MNLKGIIAVLAVLALVLMAPSSYAAANHTLTILRSVEGNWNSEILGMDGKTYIRPWVFKVENNFFSATIKRPGMPPEECKVPLEEISNIGGELKLNIVFPPYTQKANLVITQGKIKGTAWRQGRTPAPSEIIFKRR